MPFAGVFRSISCPAESFGLPVYHEKIMLVKIAQLREIINSSLYLPAALAEAPL